MDTNHNSARLYGSHGQRRTAIRNRHRSLIQELEGPEPAMIFYVVGYLIVLVILALFLQWNSCSWWVIFMLAYTIGGTLNHGLGVAIHDLGHDLVFHSHWANMLGVLFADLAHVLPFGIPFVHFHRKHHAFINNDFYDLTMPSPWEDRVFGGSIVGKLIWMAFNSPIQLIRAYERYGGFSSVKPRSWLIANAVANMTFIVSLYWLGGWSSVAFIGLSAFFASSLLHPTGGRWISEHSQPISTGSTDIDDPKQETYSYYGPFNNIMLNIGFHNEHHDFPTISCLYLPTLRAYASEFYNPLKTHNSYLSLLWTFLTDPNYRLDGRTRKVHKGSNKSE